VAPPLPLALAALLLAVPAEEEPPEVAPRTMAFGGLGAGDANLYGELGWMKSGLRADVGIAGGIDLTVRAEAFLLHDLPRGQNGGALGLRWSPAPGAFLLGAVALEGSLYALREPFGSALVYALRGEGHLGVGLERLGTAYLRAALRTAHGGDARAEVWQADGEAGLGWELQRGRWLAGAEGFLWLRPGLAPLPQWRIRAGRAL
jgi:hypothetical protein